MAGALRLAAFTRARKVDVTTIVLHGSAGKSAESSVSWLAKIGLSYHYIIERDGKVTKLAPVNREAFHAGVSKGPNGPNVNRYSVGICFATDEKEPITLAQIAAAKQLCKDICKVVPTIRHLTCHKHISPGRKTDPARLSTKTLGEMASELKLWVFTG